MINKMLIEMLSVGEWQSAIDFAHSYLES